MKRTLLALVIGLAFAGQACAATAFWTGQMEMATSVTGMVGWKCQYNYAGQTFWRMFVGSCPSSVEVQ